MKRVVIIGAGLTGISAAYHLESIGFTFYDLYEQHETIGGLTRSVKDSGFTFDYTGHFLHSNNPYFSTLIHKLFPANDLDTITRKAFIFSNGMYTPYPFQTNLSGLPLDIICECVEEFARKPRIQKEPKNLREWLLQGFGKGMCKHFFFPYNRKILSYPLNKTMPEQGGRFVPNTSLKEILNNLTLSSTTSKAGYNSNFLYPKSGGIQELANRLQQQLIQTPHTNHAVAHIDPHKKNITFVNGKNVSYDILISTMPLDKLLEVTQFGSSFSLTDQRKNLICNTVINLNLGINRETVNDKHWIYFPEKAYSFYRLGFWSSISSSMAPLGTSSLYGEVSLLNPSQRAINQKTLQAKREIMSLFKIKQEEICIEKILKLDHAYVIYNKWRKDNLEALLQKLSEQFGIYSIGRFGGWKYSSMQEAVLDGQKVALDIAQRSEFHIPLLEKNVAQNL